MKIVDDGERASTYRGAKYGTIAGFIATWSIINFLYKRSNNNRLL